MEKIVIDFILVSTGLIVMLGYHSWLLSQIMKNPSKTVIGVNSIFRRFWVQTMMEDVSKNGILSVQTLRNKIMASTVLASMAVMLCSLMAILMTNGNKTDDLKPMSSFVFEGDKSLAIFTLKYFCIFLCFLAAFFLSVQSIRYYSHACILINVPFKGITKDKRQRELTVDYVARNVNRGSYFWSLGLRAFYFSFPLFLWIFGPIPMFVSCFVLVFLLYFLDFTVECQWVGGVFLDDHKGDDNGPNDEELGKIN